MSFRGCSNCAKQIHRLQARPFYGTLGEHGIFELTRTLHENGHDKAEWVISEALIRLFGAKGDEDRVPSTHDLWAICREDPKDYQTRKDKAIRLTRASSDCQFCFGEGWEAAMIRQNRGPFRGQMYEHMQRCRCGGYPAGGGAKLKADNHAV